MHERTMGQSFKGWKLKFKCKGNKRLLWFLCLTTVRNALKRKSTGNEMDKNQGEKIKHFDKEIELLKNGSDYIDINKVYLL